MHHQIEIKFITFTRKYLLSFPIPGALINMESSWLLIKKEALECPLCYESNIDYFCVFACGHSICNDCTAIIAGQLKLTWTGRQYYECPICRHHVYKTERPPRNFVAQVCKCFNLYFVSKLCGARCKITSPTVHYTAGSKSECVAAGCCRSALLFHSVSLQ